LTNYGFNMKQANIQKGRIGERAAVEYLKEKGYTIVEVNYRTRFGEIDIICETKGSELTPRSRGLELTLVFVEVKTKTGEEFGEPWEMVDSRKLGQINRIAQMYLIKKKLGERLCRIDVIGVWLSREERVERLEHWENVGG
jgi:putative endonuclease